MHSKSKIDNKIQHVSDSTTQDGTYSIGEAAKMIGSTVKTVRYYDEIGLVKPTSYTEGGHRLYTTEDIWRLELITTLRYLDFGIDEISKMISGEIPVAKALDWQIESLETQVSTLMNMISIFRQAKEHEGDSLRYIYDLVNTRVINPEKRNQFITEKVEKSKFLDGISEEWRGSLFYFFNKYIINQVKVSAKQTVAWNELQELVNDSQFLSDLRHDEFLFFNMVHQPRFDAATWVKKLEDIHIRLDTALKQKCSADSPFVQTIVEDTAMLYANSDQSINKEEFFRYFAEYAQNPRTERIERFNTLCSILSPKFRSFSKGNTLLLQGIQWKLEHM
ncbi:MerR family transcriptional regulator [Paenibacillus profundus]|uniref:MerR family transcriptional regulator n=1 Tax=Paenibacillus profundus TaxID=1173085 RepID=A0ABS8YQZ0_9BACL|nr:MerR family transcriptional regulator [Paenibacillus profundus]MCE5172717.1 MerR family transcriptional regulator [Paenibacillus profundus]